MAPRSRIVDRPGYRLARARAGRGGRGLVGGVAALLLLLLAPAGIALAHSNLESSDPAAGAVLEESPPRVALTFSENPDPDASVVRLLDAAGKVVVDGPGEVDPAHPKDLVLTLPPLPDGTYSAVYQVRSAVDGHITNGSVGFSVGAASPLASLLPPPGTADPATELPSPVDTLLRWLSFLAAAVALGPILFGLLVWRPAFRRWPGANEAADVQVGRLLRRLSLIGAGALVAVTVAFAIWQALQVPAGSHARGGLAVFGDRVSLLLASRLVLLALLAESAWRLTPPATARRGPWLSAAGWGLAALLTFSLIAHGGGLGPPWPAPAILLDWLHMTAMAAWFGGLVPLGLLLWRRDRPDDLFAALIPRFSLVALASVATVGLTGVFSAALHVRTLQALVDTAYGRVVMAKVGLFFLLGVLGAVNLLLLSPRLRTALAFAVRWLRRVVRAELALAVLVLLAAGVLTGTLPAFEALQAQARLGAVERARIDRVRLILRVAPLRAGENELAVDVIDRRPEAAATPATVLLRLTMTTSDMGTSQVEAKADGDRRFTARGSFLSMAGPWQVEVIVRHPGVNDVRHTFTLDVGP